MPARGRLTAVNALPVHSGVYRHQDSQLRLVSVRRFLQPIHHLGVVGHQHESGILLRQGYGALDIVDANRLLGPQNALDPRSGE